MKYKKTSENKFEKKIEKCKKKKREKWRRPKLAEVENKRNKKGERRFEVNRRQPNLLPPHGQEFPALI